MTAKWRSVTLVIAPQLIHSEVTVPTSLIIVTVKGRAGPPCRGPPEFPVAIGDNQELRRAIMLWWLTFNWILIACQSSQSNSVISKCTLQTSSHNFSPFNIFPVISVKNSIYVIKLDMLILLTIYQYQIKEKYWKEMYRKNKTNYINAKWQIPVPGKTGEKCAIFFKYTGVT